MRHAIRTLINSPGFTLVAVATLALGVGANAAMFSAVNGVLLKPLPFSNPDSLVHIWTENHSGVKSSQAPGSYLDIRRQNRSLVEMAGYRTDMIGLATNAEPLQVEGVYVTSEFFDVLGTPAAYGQAFSKARGQHPGERLVVLGDEAARRLFGTPDAAAGRPVRVNAESYVVAAVMPASFAWPRSAGVWVLSAKDVPPAPIEGADAPTNRDIRYFEAVGRLKPDVTLAQAQQDLDRVAVQMAAEHGNTEARAIGLTPVREEIIGDVSGALWLLQAAVCLVLLIACANISSLLIARATGRRRELAIRAALGAGRGRLIRELLTESLIIGTAGGLAGLLLGAWLIAVLVRVLPENVPRATNIGLDVTVTAVTIAAALLASVLFGILPALQGSRADAIVAMKEAGDRGGSARARGRAALVVGEIALTLVLLVGAGLLINSLMRLQRVDTGMRPEHATVAFLNVPQTRYATAAAQTQLYGRLIEDLSGLPQIDAVGVGFPGPLHGSSASGSFDIEGYTPPTRADRPFAYIGTISGNYLAALGVPLLSGRTFTASDSAEAPPVVLVSAALARKYWPGENPVGKRIRFDDDPKSPWVTVVGLVGDTRQLGLREPAPALLYFP
ncbi:MAG TPA: ABC transporter permease, partial [Vicinamibacterales bacterium]|nr:ABC transporter permease [Vicinamibacterales bacterium]